MVDLKIIVPCMFFVLLTQMLYKNPAWFQCMFNLMLCINTYYNGNVGELVKLFSLFLCLGSSAAGPSSWFCALLMLCVWLFVIDIAPLPTPLFIFIFYYTV